MWTDFNNIWIPEYEHFDTTLQYYWMVTEQYISPLLFPVPSNMEVPETDKVT